jgi:hypothetical protein
MEVEPAIDGGGAGAPRGNPGVPGRQGGGGDGVAAAATEAALVRASAPGVRAVVLVEGVSDQAAVEALARRRGRDLAAEGVVVVPMGGATSVCRFLDRFGPGGAGLRMAGLCDAGEEAAFRRALDLAGVEVVDQRRFHVCHADLEDELIRALGAAAVERVVEADGNGRALRTFRKQRAQRGRSPEVQLRRFVGSRSGGKAHAARLLVEALDDDRVPPPLDRLLRDL